MPKFQEILETIKMIHLENLDLRAVTMGISLWECAGSGDTKGRIREKILNSASDLVSSCKKLEQKYGIPIVNKRLAISPIALVAAQSSMEQMIEIAEMLDKTCKEINIDLVGGYSALVHKGVKRGDQNYWSQFP